MRHWFTAALLIFGLGCRAAAPTPPLIGTSELSVEPWESLLTSSVTAEGRIRYRAIAEQRAALDNFLASVARSEPVGHQRRGLAHWLNVYQALAIRSVLDAGEITSIHDDPDFFAGRAFEVSREWRSLAEIRQEKIRLRYLDYRTYAAINPGFAGGPPVRAGLYHADTLDAELDEQFQRWIATFPTPADVAGFHPWWNEFGDDFADWTGGLDLCTLAARHSDGERHSGFERLAKTGCPHRFFALDDRLNRAD